MTHIPPETAQAKFKSMKRYAQVRDIKNIMSKHAKANQDKDALAIDCLQGPITSFTNLPYWLIAYLHHHQDKPVEVSEIYEAANRLGYRANDVKATIRFLEDTQANIGHWQDQKDKLRYMRWYPMEAPAIKIQECQDRGDEW